MADDLKLKIQLEATSDKKQVEGEAKDVAKTANDTLKLEKIRLQLDKASLEKELKNLLTEISKAKVRWNKDLEFYATLEAKSVINQIWTIDKQIEDLDKKMTWWTPSATGGLLWKLKNFVKWAAIATAFTKLSKSVLELWSNAQQAQISFTTMLWDAKKAEELLSRLSEFARKTPFELSWIRESATQLLAMGVTADEMVPTLKALWDVSAWLNVPLERLALNYGQVLTQWKLTWKELKDFTTAGVPLLDELAKNLWKTKTEIQDMVSAGQIWAQDMVKAFNTMTSEGGKFANLMEAQSNTLQGKWSNLKDWLASIWETIWLAVIPPISDLVGKIWNWIEETWESIKTLASQAFWNISNAVSNIFGVLSDLWDAFSSLFYWIKSDGSSSAITFWQVFSAVLQKIWQWIEAASLMITQLRDLMKTGTNNVQNWLWWIKSWYDAFANDFFVKWKSWTESYGNAMRAFGTYNAKEVKSVENTLKGLSDDWEDFWAKVIKQEEDLASSFVKTWNYLKDNPLTKWIDKNGWWILGDTLLWWSGSWWSKSKASEMTDDFKKEMSDLYSEMNSSVNDHQKTYDNLVKNIEKVEKEYDKLRESATKTWESAEKSIRSYNEQLENVQADAVTNLGQRYVELKRELSEVDSWMKKVAEWLSRKEIDWMQWEWVTEYRWYNLNDLVKLKEQLDEMKLIEENTTEEQRQQEEFIKKTSKAQEILNSLNEKSAELEEKKAIALEKQAIAQAMMNQQDWKQNIVTLTKNGEDIGTYYYDSLEQTRKKIEDESNIQYAKQLELQSTNLNEQLAQYQSEKDYEVEILVNITARKVQLEEQYNKVFQDAITKQKKSVEELISYWDRLIARKNEYYGTSWSARAYGWDISNAKVTLVWENWPEQIIARQASYVQPRNASNTYSTVNNTDNSSTLTINWMSNTYGSIDEMLDDLRWRLTYRN